VVACWSVSTALRDLDATKLVTIKCSPNLPRISVKIDLMWVAPLTLFVGQSIWMTSCVLHDLVFP
jgi:hypothetical protein